MCSVVVVAVAVVVAAVAVAVAAAAAVVSRSGNSRGGGAKREILDFFTFFASVWSGLSQGHILGPKV